MITFQKMKINKMLKASVLIVMSVLLNQSCSSQRNDDYIELSFFLQCDSTLIQPMDVYSSSLNIEQLEQTAIERSFLKKINEEGQISLASIRNSQTLLVKISDLGMDSTMLNIPFLMFPSRHFNSDTTIVLNAVYKIKISNQIQVKLIGDDSTSKIEISEMHPGRVIYSISESFGSDSWFISTSPTVDIRFYNTDTLVWKLKTSTLDCKKVNNLSDLISRKIEPRQ